LIAVNAGSVFEMLVTNTTSSAFTGPAVGRTANARFHS